MGISNLKKIQCVSRMTSRQDLDPLSDLDQTQKPHHLGLQIITFSRFLKIHYSLPTDSVRVFYLHATLQSILENAKGKALDLLITWHGSRGGWHRGRLRLRRPGLHWKHLKNY